MRRVLVLGGAGLVGSAVTRALQTSPFGFQPIIVDRREPEDTAATAADEIGVGVDIFEPGVVDRLVRRHGAVAVIDTVNDASIFSRNGDPMAALTAYWRDIIRPVVASNVAWVDVGTVGTGGMGCNIPFTHNEATDGHIAEGLVRKLTAAGAHGALLDVLGRTPGYRVGRVVPRAMIGFGKAVYGPVHVAHIQGGAKDVRGHWVSRRAMPEELRFEIGGPYLGVGTRCGENGKFAMLETRAITGIGMMETVTAEHVARAVLDVLVRVMTGAGTFVQYDVHPDITSYAERARILREMERLCEEHRVPSVIFGNLGPFMTTQMWELWVLGQLGVTPQMLAHGDPLDDKFAHFHQSDEAAELAQLLPGLGLPMVMEGHFLPAYEGLEALRLNGILEQLRRVELTDSKRLWAVDLRSVALDRWRIAAQRIIATDTRDYPRSNLPIDPCKPINAADFWTAYMTVTGHGRAPYQDGSTYSS